MRYGIQWLAANWIGGESGATASEELLTLFGPQFLKAVRRFVQISGLSAPRGRDVEGTECAKPPCIQPYIGRT